MPPVRPERRRRLLPAVLMVACAGAIAWGGPRLVRARAALQWTRYHAAKPPDKSGVNAREASRWAAVTLWGGAPLPWGSEACRLALDYGARQEAESPEAALALYERLRENLESITMRRGRGIGLAGVLDEVRAREKDLRARKTAAPPAT